MKSLKSIFFVYFLLFVFALGCGRKTEGVHKEEAPPVSISSVRQEDLNEFLFYSGDIEAQDEATVYSKVTGKLVENKVQEGDTVEKGQTLVLVDRDEVGYEFELAPVVSPIKGIIGRAYLDKGANVTLQTPLVLIVNMDEVKVKIDVTEKDLPKIKRDLSAEISVDAYPGETFEGRLEKVSPIVDLNSRTAPVWINIANPEYRLNPGMFARIKLMVGEHKDVLVIMRESVIEIDSQKYVFVVENDKAYMRNVKLGLSSDGNYEVLKGLKFQEKVIVMGPADLKDGDKVRIVEEIK